MASLLDESRRVFTSLSFVDHEKQRQDGLAVQPLPSAPTLTILIDIPKAPPMTGLIDTSKKRRHSRSSSGADAMAGRLAAQASYLSAVRQRL
jgi:hypothetical protein